MEVTSLHPAFAAPFSERAELANCVTPFSALIIIASGVEAQNREGKSIAS